MRLPIFLFALIFTSLIGFEIYTNAHNAKQTAQFRLLAEEANQLAVELESSLGYGGLIHNFKNAVLRADRPDYIEQTRINVANTLALIKELKAILVQLDIAPQLGPVTDMVNAYAQRLEQLGPLHDAGMDIAEIDARVSYNDAAAIDAANKTVADINAQTKAALNALARSSLIQNIVGITIAIASIVLLFLYNTRRTQALSLNAVAKANNQLAQANENLNKSNTALKQFAGIASHDLRAPARTISMLSHAVIEENEDPKAVASYAQMILDVSSKMTELITSLLDFTRNGFKKPSYETVDLTDLVQTLAAGLGLSFAGPDKQLSISDLPILECDRVLMQRLFENMLSNSIKYAQDPASIDISITGQDFGNQVIISIADKGIGIEPAYADKIFEPLQRLHTDDSGYDGVGIGLALVRSIVEAHSGTIRLDTDYEHGARFVISLPARLKRQEEILVKAA